MTELMQLWDGLSSSGQDRVVVLAATNRPWDLDPAVQVRAVLLSIRACVPWRHFLTAAETYLYWFSVPILYIFSDD